MNLGSECTHFLFKKCIWKCRLQNGCSGRECVPKFRSIHALNGKTIYYTILNKSVDKKNTTPHYLHNVAPPCPRDWFVSHCYIGWPNFRKYNVPIIVSLPSFSRVSNNTTIPIGYQILFSMNLYSFMNFIETYILGFAYTANCRLNLSPAAPLEQIFHLAVYCIKLNIFV